MSTLQEFLIKSAGMEKQALNLSSLLRMGRNAAAKGKLQRFSNLLDMRNTAISKVSPDRHAKLMRELNSVLAIPKSLRPGFYSPKSLKLRILTDRLPMHKGWTDRIINNRRNINSWDNLADVTQVADELHLGTAGPWSIQDLARYGSLQKATNKLDNPTFPG